MKNGEYAKIVSRNLRLLMYQTGVTQAKLSRDLKIPKTTISGWLNSNRNPRMENIDALCHYFNVTRTDLMDDKHGYYEKTMRPESSGDVEAMFSALNEKGQKVALEYLQFLLSKEEYKKSKVRLA